MKLFYLAVFIDFLKILKTHEKNCWHSKTKQESLLLVKINLESFLLENFAKKTPWRHFAGQENVVVFSSK